MPRCPFCGAYTNNLGFHYASGMCLDSENKTERKVNKKIVKLRLINFHEPSSIRNISENFTLTYDLCTSSPRGRMTIKFSPSQGIVNLHLEITDGEDMLLLELPLDKILNDIRATAAQPIPISVS